MSDELATLRAAAARAKNREGVPMVVALVDERGGSGLPATAPAVRADGVALARRVREIRSLAPSMAEQDNGAVITALVVVAHDLLPVAGGDLGVDRDLRGATSHAGDR